VQSTDPVIIAAGDIARCGSVEQWETASLLDGIEGAILTLGDNAYEVASLQELNDCYGPTWGRHKARTRPAIGNHEYGAGNPIGYFTYFGDAATPLEPGCTNECKGYYSFDIGAWHLIALNSEIAAHAGSDQEQWLRADLAAHPTTCTLAYWHRPRFSSGDHGNNPQLHDLWQALYDYGADVVLTGHDHNYERFAPQNPHAQPDPGRGIRQFVVGTGGATLRDFTFIQPNSEARNSETWGVLKMTLHPTSYDWEFIPIARQTFRDASSDSCVTVDGAPPAPPPAATTIATTPTATSPAASSPAAATPVPVTVQAPAGGANYTIQSGDTLSSIAARHGLAWPQLAAANGLSETSILQVGQIIRLPGVQTTSAPSTASTQINILTPVSTAVTNAPVTTTTTTTTTLATTGTTPGGATAPAAANTATTATAAGSYTVQAGDTLWSIAVRNNTTWQALAAANGMSESTPLQVGRQLVIPGGAAAPQSVPAVAIQPTPVATPAPAVGGVGPQFHTVASGDTLITIGARYGVDWRQLQQLNGLAESSILQVGQQIRLQ
jgi:LysM repeat protein